MNDQPQPLARPTRRLAPRARVLEGLVLALTCLLVFSASSYLQQVVLVAARAPVVRSDADLFRHPLVLGPEFRIVERIRADYPAGTEISVWFEDSYPVDSHLRRITRLWLALLPDYPIRSGARLVVCPLSLCQLGPGDAVVERGEVLALVRRGDG